MSIYDKALDIKVEDLQPKINLLPIGNHTVKITTVEEKQTEKGGRMLVIDFIDSQERVGRINFNVVNSNPKTVEIAFDHLKQIVAMLPKSYRDNFSKSKNPIDLVGATIYVYGVQNNYINKTTGEQVNGVNFRPDGIKALEIFNNPVKENYIPPSKETNCEEKNPFDEDVPF